MQLNIDDIQRSIDLVSIIVSVRLCGSQTPIEPIVSTGSRMLLMYKTSEHSLPHTGFLGTYEGKLKILAGCRFYFSWYCQIIQLIKMIMYLKMIG